MTFQNRKLRNQSHQKKKSKKISHFKSVSGQYPLAILKRAGISNFVDNILFNRYCCIMGLKKYKTFEQAERDQWVFHPDEQYFKKAFSLLRTRFVKKIVRKFPRGVFKYKTFEEAQEELKEIITETDVGT